MISAPSGHQSVVVTPGGRIESDGRTEVDDLRVIVRGEGAPLILGAQGNGTSLAALRDERLAALDRLADAVIGLDNEVRKAQGLAARASVDLVTQRYYHVFNGFAARVDRRSFDKLRTIPGVTGVWVDRRKAAADSDSVSLIRADQVWTQLGYRGDGITVAIIDTGVDYTRADLGGCIGAGCKVEMGWDFVNNDAQPMDDHGHGTHVAGIVAADGTLKGVAPHARLWAFKVLDQHGNGSDSTIIAGIERATNPDGNPGTQDGAKVINMSLGGLGDPDDPVSQASDNAMAGGTVVVVAAGNSGPGFSTIGSPGCARTVLTVGASDKFDQMAWFSSRGPAPGTLQIKPEIIAPGVGIVSTVPTGNCELCDPSGYRPLDGTSMAAPHAAGVAALVRQAFPSWTPAQVKAAIMQRSVDLASGAFVQGSGRLDALNAVTAGARVNVPAFSPGADDLTQPTWTRSQVFALTNLGSGSLNYTLSVAGAFPPGLSATVSPTSVSVPGNSSRTFTFTLTVNNGSVPNVSVEPFAYEGEIIASRSGETLHMPFAFIKTPSLTINFDQTPYVVDVTDNTGYWRSFNYPPPSSTLFVPSGLMLDVVTLYPDGVTFVVRESVVVTQSTVLNIAASEAIYPFTLVPVDKDGVPITITYSTTTSHLGPTSHFFEQYTNNDFGGSFGSPTTYHLSPLSNRYVFELTLLQEPGGTQPTYLYYGAALNGVHAPVTVQNAPGDFKHLTWGYKVDPGRTVASPWTWVSSRPYSAFAVIAFGQCDAIPGIPSPFKREVYLTPLSSDQAGVGFLQQHVFGAATQPQCDFYDHLFSTAYIAALSTTELDIWPMWSSMPVVKTTHPALTSGVGPFRWNGAFSNSPGSIYAFGNGGPWFVSQLHDVRPSPSIPYDVLQGGAVVQSGSLGDDASTLQIPVPPNTYGLDIRFNQWFLGSQPGRARAQLSFDTTRADPNPPHLDGLTIDGGSDFVELVPPAGATVKFRGSDDTGASPLAKLYYKTAGGFVAAPVSGSSAAGYTAVLPPPGGAAPTGPVALSLSDASSNTLVYSACSAATATPEVCDGFDDDCDGVVPANEKDGDGDGTIGCADCNDGDPAIWSTPGEVPGLVFVTRTALLWASASGGASSTYDLLRSGSPQEFVAGTTCVVTHTSGTVASDSATPAPGARFYYLVRAANACPVGQGSLGSTSAGVARAGRSCP
jgi:subtilisin family serine protease